MNDMHSRPPAPLLHRAASSGRFSAFVEEEQAANGSYPGARADPVVLDVF